MIELAFLTNYAPLLILLVSFILIYAALTLMKLPGTNVTLAILSLLLSLIFVSSTKAVKYVFSLIPFLSVIMIISVFILIMLMFTAKNIDSFKKPLAIIGFILAILLVLGFAFHQFSTLNHMLPGTSNAGLDTGAKEIKSWIYSHEVVNTLIFAGSVILVWFFMLKKAGK